MQRSADKTIATLKASARLNPYLGVVNSSVSGGKQQQKEQSQLPERLKSPLSTSTRDEKSLDIINSEKLNKGYDEVKIKETKGAEEIKSIEKRTSIELDGNRIGNVPAPTPELIDLSQLLRNHRSSSSCFASPSTSLTSSTRGRTSSKSSVNRVSYPSSSPDAKYSPTKTKVLAGAGGSRSSAAPPPTASVTTRTPVTTSIKEAASVSSQSAFRPTTTNAELVAAPIQPATPASIFTSPFSESSRLASASAMINKPVPLSQTSTPVVANSTFAALPIFPNTTPVAPSVLGPVASPAAISNELPPPSQASTNMTQDEISVSKLVIEKEKENNEGEAGKLVEKIIGKIELKTASRKLEEEEEEEEEEEIQPDLPCSLSLSPLSSLSPSISSSPYLLVKGPSTPRPRSALIFTPLPRSPLASVSSKNQTQIDQAPESPSPPPTPFVAVVSSSCSLTTMDLVNDQPELQLPLFNSPFTNNIPVEQRKEGEEESVSYKLKSPDDNNGTTNSAIPTTTPSSEVALSGLPHIPTQTPASIGTSLRPSPMSKVEKGKRTVEGTHTAQVEKVYVSLGDNADIVRVKKRKVLEGSSMTDREPLANPVAKGKGKAREEEIDDLVAETKSGEAVKKRGLLNLKAGKGDSLAVTRVRKRKARPGSVADGEANGVGQHDDGLDLEMPLKRARQRVSDSQMKTEPTEKGKQLPRPGLFALAGPVTKALKPSVKKGPPSKGRLSVNRGQGKAEVEWPTITNEYGSEDVNIKSSPFHTH